MPAGLRATCPSVTGVGDVRQVFDLSTNLPAEEVGIDLTALMAAQMTDADAAQLSRLKSFNFSFVMFKEIKLFCDVWTEVKTRKELHPPAGSGSVPPLSRGFGTMEDAAELPWIHSSNTRV